MPKLVNGLSQKMKDFCYAYVRTSNARQAYMEAYDCHSENAANVESNKLLQRDDITEFINELNKPMVNKVTNERNRKRTIIWNRINRAIEKDDDSAIARYMDILNKMDMEYVNVNRNIDDSGESLAGLDTEQLKALLDKKTE